MSGTRPAHAPICPTCGQRAWCTQTVYGVRFDCCGLTAWGNDKPLETKEQRAARREAFRMNKKSRKK